MWDLNSLAHLWCVSGQYIELIRSLRGHSVLYLTKSIQHQQNKIDHTPFRHLCVWKKSVATYTNCREASTTRLWIQLLEDGPSTKLVRNSEHNLQRSSFFPFWIIILFLFNQMDQHVATVPSSTSGSTSLANPVNPNICDMQPGCVSPKAKWVVFQTAHASRHSKNKCLIVSSLRQKEYVLLPW